jgi:aminotransferase
MSLSENQRLAEIVQFEIRAMTLTCMQGQGINMAQGGCDTAVSPTVVDTAKHVMDHGFNTYTGYDGLAELRQALAQRAVVAVPRMVSLQEPDWFLSMEVLEKAITDRTKAIVVNTPSNPSGKVFTTQEFRRNCNSTPCA